MSHKTKSDLLVRVRFENPLPPPPFPPKLFNVSTQIGRLGEPAYLDQLASSAPIPMLADAEMGMPIDLNVYQGVWEGDDGELNPVPDVDRVQDATDALLLTPLNVTNAAAPAKADVSWMRNSSYIQRRNGVVRRAAAEAQRQEVVDHSEAAQLAAIDKTFQDVRATSAKDMKHPDPKRRHLKVVEEYDILPDPEAWSNSYILVKFPERPSASTALNPTATASRARLESAVLRPIVEDDQQIIEYYLPGEDGVDKLAHVYATPLDGDGVEQLNTTAEAGGDVDAVFPNVPYDRIRTYEVVMQTVPSKEILFSFHEDEKDDDDDMFGGEDDDDEEPKRKRRKGAYYNPIAFRTQLRKTRVSKRGQQETRNDNWDKIRVGYRVPDEDEVDERRGKDEQVDEPHWVEKKLDELRGGGDPGGEKMGEAIQEDE